LAEAIRVGIGYDIHRLADGHRLVLGGVEIPHGVGLIGHSDADVVLHAVTDALLGAAGLPDIGELFPDTDPAFRNADSRRLLTDVRERVRAKGFVAGNVDVIVHAEAPRLSPFKERIAKSISALLAISPAQVSIKAKTNEGVGPVGRAEAIACTAIVTALPCEPV